MARRWWLPWLRRYAGDEEMILTEEDQLPDGLFERDGKIMFTCRGCDKSVPLEVDVSEFDPDVAYCGGSPWCLP
jgi:hypothetical protein